MSFETTKTGKLEGYGSDPRWYALAEGRNNFSELNSDHLDSYGIEDDEQIENMNPADQLACLQSMIEAAEADTEYAYTKAYEVFGHIAKNSKYPPLIRAIARVGKSLDPTDDRYIDDDKKTRPRAKEEEFGYSTIVTPEMLPEGVLTPEVEAMNEDEIRFNLHQLEKKMEEWDGRFVETDSEEDLLILMQQDFNTMNEYELALEKIIFARNQAKLHKEFPGLPKEKQLVKIASDAAAIVEFNKKYDENEAWFSLSASIGSIYGSGGKEVKLDGEMLTYLSAVHQSGVLKLEIEKELGLNLTDISINAQVQLLKFMAEAGSERFDKLCSTLQVVSSKLRLKLAESFLAADFGEDFGDALLTIAGSERMSTQEKERIFDTIGSCRESIRKITELYSDFDGGQFAKEYARAANERLTDAATVFSQIAKSGKAVADLGWAGRPEFDYKSAIEALEYERRSLEIISGTLGDVKAGEKGAFAEIVMPPDASKQRLWRTVYNFYSPRHGYVLLYTRPEGSHSLDPSVDYGKVVRSPYDANSVNAGVEASISLITNPVEPFSLPSPYRPDSMALKNPRFYDSITMDKVSALRLDREGRAPGMAANDPNRDPVNKIGMVSVDLAAIGDRSDTPSGKIARLLSVGGKLREGISGADSALNHNTKWFDQAKYGTDKGFRELVEYINEKAMGWCAEHGPLESDKSFRRLMKQARGRKAIGRRVA